MSLLTAPIVKNSHIFPGIYFIFLKKRPIQNFKFFKKQIWTYLKKKKTKKKRKNTRNYKYSEATDTDNLRNCKIRFQTFDSILMKSGHKVSHLRRCVYIQ